MYLDVLEGLKERVDIHTPGVIEAEIMVFQHMLDPRAQSGGLELSESRTSTSDVDNGRSRSSLRQGCRSQNAPMLS